MVSIVSRKTIVLWISLVISYFVIQIREGDKGIMQVLDWYNQINSFMLDYISTSVKESDLSSFYRLIIAFKNLQRSVEFSGKSGIFGIR